MTTLHDEIDRAIGERLKGTTPGLSALTSGPVELGPEASAAMDDILALRTIALNAAKMIDSRIQQLS